MLRRGDYVLCNFPFRGIRRPGPSPHIVLCAATGRLGSTNFAIVFYTTSQIAYEGARRPRQYLLVDEARAQALGQRKPFHVDASRIARLPVTTDYFPRTERGDMHIFGHDPEFVATVEHRLEALLAAGLEVVRDDHASPR